MLNSLLLIVAFPAVAEFRNIVWPGTPSIDSLLIVCTLAEF